MKLPLLLAIAAALPFASAQPPPMTGEQRYHYYRSRGLSLDNYPEPMKKSAPRDYPMRGIPITDPKFQAVFDAVVATLAKRSPTLPPRTVRDFSDHLQMGETYLITKGDVTETCDKCRGAGRTPDTSKSLRIGDGKIECKDCKGTGKITRILQLLVKW